MTTLTELLNTTSAQTLGWVLLHSFWQGALVALGLVLLLRLTRASSPPVRYFASCLTLALMLLLPTLSYAVLSSRAQPVPEVTYELVVLSVQLTHTAETGAVGAIGTHQTPTQGLPALAPRGFKPYLPYLVALWALGVLFLSVRLLGGLWLLRKLKRRFNQPVPEELVGKCHELARRLGITRAVALRESLSVNVPLVIGWLRPAILLPTSAMSGLSVTQLEMILAHELAHLRRNDYLVNLLQHLAETLLFYHPAVWWVSAKIREEREHCCDDMALRVCNGNKLNYAKALATLDDLRLTHLAPAATGGSLLGRIERLAGKALPQTTNPMQWVVGLVLILAPLLSISFVRANQDQPVLLGTYTAGPLTVAELTRQGFTAEAACENSGPWVVVFSEKGFFSGNVDAEAGCTYQNPFVTGSWRLSGNTITFQDSQDLGCGTQEYSYTFRLRSSTLTLSPLKDSCRERVYILTSQAWKKP